MAAYITLTPCYHPLFFSIMPLGAGWGPSLVNFRSGVGLVPSPCLLWSKWAYFPVLFFNRSRRTLVVLVPGTRYHEIEHVLLAPGSVPRTHGTATTSLKHLFFLGFPRKV